MMYDLLTTSKEHDERCLAAARTKGLTRVRLGNIQLLGNDYDWDSLTIYFLLYVMPKLSMYIPNLKSKARNPKQFVMVRCTTCKR